VAQLSFLPAVQTQEFRMAEGVYDHKGSSIDGGTAIDLERLVPARTGRSGVKSDLSLADVQRVGYHAG